MKTIKKKDFPTKAGLNGEFKVTIFPRIGYYTGLFPVHNLFNSSGTSELEFKKCSFQFLYSMIMLAYKFYILLQFWEFGAFYISLDPEAAAHESGTTYYARTIAYAFSFCTGPFMHALCLYKLNDFLEMWKEIELYFNKYGLNMANLKWSKMQASFLFMSIIIQISGPVMPSFFTAARYSGPLEFYLISNIVSVKNLYFVSIYMIFAFFLLEMSSTFVMFQIFFSSKILLTQLDELILTVIKKREIETNKINSISEEYYLPTSWEFIGNQYLDYLCVFKKYQTFIGPYFVLMLGNLMASCTCMIFYLITSEDVFAKDTKHILTFIVIFGIVRLFNMVNCGDKIQVAYKKLVLEIMKSYQKQQNGYLSVQSVQIEKVIKLVTSSSLGLRAAGFFTVSRRNVTSILSSVLTYIIVLFQFRSDDDVPNSGNQSSISGLLANNATNGTTLNSSCNCTAAAE